MIGVRSVQTLLTGTAGARKRLFVIVGSGALFALCAVVAVFLGHGIAAREKLDADAHALARAQILITLGAELPHLTPRVLRAGLPDTVAGHLDLTVARGQRQGTLADLTLWGADGHVVYGSADAPAGTRMHLDSEVAAALAGHATTVTEAHAIDPSSGRRTGVLEALTPLVDGHGKIYGALSASLSLKPIADHAARAGQRITLILIGVCLVAWLLLMPLTLRLAGLQATSWHPGRRKTLRAFRYALDHDEIELVYQPQVRTEDRRIDGVEALVRWRHDGTLIGPDAFLPAVESSRLMSELTDRVLDLALAQLARWRAAGIVLRMSVNLSATDISDDKLAQRVAAKLAEHGVMGRDLTVEVTETALFEDTQQARRVLIALDQMGIDISVDDFGTGHASIARLLDLPVREVKIDRSFVSDTSPRARGFLDGIIVFGRTVGLRMVAEGVEDAETLQTIATLGCHLAQGYHISRPLEAAAMTRWLDTTHPVVTPLAPV